MTSTSIGLLFIAFLLRICLGPFTNAGVVAFHYASRVTFVSFITMLTYKTVLNICFLIDFDKMAAVSEKKVMVVMGVFTSVTTLAHLAEEAVTRTLLELDHYARWCFNIYLGEVTFVIVYLVNHIPFLVGKYFCTPEKCWRHWWTASHSHIIPHCFPSHLVGT